MEIYILKKPKIIIPFKFNYFIELQTVMHGTSIATDSKLSVHVEKVELQRY